MCGVSALSLILNILTFLILTRAKRESEREENREDNEGKDLYMAKRFIKVFSAFKCWICLILRSCVYVDGREIGKNE